MVSKDKLIGKYDRPIVPVENPIILDPNTELRPTKVKANIPLVDEARKQSVQGADKKNVSDGIAYQIASIFSSADTLPPWWSTKRDTALADLWRASDLLKGAMYMMASKMSTIPFHIEPRDMSITKHLAVADKFQRRLIESADFGRGWGAFMQKQMLSLLGQDNGRFMEIIDLAPDKTGPIRGPALSISHLDPSRCQRTSDPEFPVLYQRPSDGKFVKMHWTRVAYEAQLPSEKATMLGVGVCAVSRAASYAQHMLDVATYKEEKLGSRPLRGVMLVGGGLDAEAVGTALSAASKMSDARGLDRFSLLPIVGDTDIEDPTMELIQLSNLPDGFEEDKATAIAMAVIALAFGVDARELWPGMQQSSTRADALLSHIKQRGKGPGHIIQETERMFNNWFLPPFLKLVFDFQDDAQDRQRAEIRKERAATRTTDIANGITTTRIERQHMLSEGELSNAQFDEAELEDGRLPDGSPIQVLFHNPAEVFVNLLTLPGIPNPLDTRSNDPEKVLNMVSVKLSDAYKELAETTRQIQKTRIMQAIGALEFLQREYQSLLLIEEAEEAELLNPTNPPVSRVNPESETPINARPDDEENMMALENSPRELTGKERIKKRFKKLQKEKQLDLEI